MQDAKSERMKEGAGDPKREWDRLMRGLARCRDTVLSVMLGPSRWAPMMLQGKVSLVYSLPSEKYWSRRQDEFSQLFQEGYVLLQCKAVKGKCQSKYRNVEKQSNSQTQRQKHNICPLGIRITQTNRLPSDCLKTQRQTHKVYPLKVRAKGSGHSYLAQQINEWR